MASEKFHLEKPDYRLLGKCPVCKALFHGEQSTLVERRGKSALFHIDCARCKSSVLLMVVSGPMNFMTTIGMLTDISKHDAERMKSQARVSTDDVLILHNYYKGRGV